MIPEEVSKKREPDPIEKPEAKRPKTVNNDNVPNKVTFVLEKEFKSPISLSAVKFSPNGKFIACAGTQLSSFLSCLFLVATDNTIKILDVDALNNMCHVLKGHTAGNINNNNRSTSRLA